MTDISGLSPEKQTELRHIEAKILLQIKWAITHALTAHPQHPPIVVSTGLCGDSVMVVCGTKLFERLQALQAEASELYATGLTDVVVQKMKGGA